MALQRSETDDGSALPVLGRYKLEVDVVSGGPEAVIGHDSCHDLRLHKHRRHLSTGCLTAGSGTSAVDQSRLTLVSLASR